MPLTRIEPYRPPRPTIRELMEGRPAGEDDGGVPPKGCLGRPPRSAYRSEDRAEATSGEHTEQGNDTKRAGRRQRGGEGREGRERKLVQQRGLNGWVARHGRGPPGATPQDGGGTGREHRTETRWRYSDVVLACREEGTKQKKKKGEKKKNKKGGNKSGQHHKEAGRKKKSG